MLSVQQVTSYNNDINNVSSVQIKQKRIRLAVAKPGDIVTIDWELHPEHGFVPEPLFDFSGRITFVLGWGNYLPGLHELVEGDAASDDDEVVRVSLDAGWGARRPELVVSVPKNQLNLDGALAKIEPGKTTLSLKDGNVTTRVLVTQVTEDAIVLDANPPLAGSSYACQLKVVAVEPMSPALLSATVSGGASTDASGIADMEDTNSCSSSHYKVATFALGCFWGAELAFMRVSGVVGTKVGYSQGVTKDPTYEQVCTGQTKHRETVLVVYDERVVSYRELAQVALGRLRDMGAASGTVLQKSDDSFGDSFRSVIDASSLFQEPNEQENRQYRHGFYYHSGEQLQIANEILSTGGSAAYGIELLQADIFYDAESWHQQYLYKGGQSAKKGCKTPIRCYG